MNKVSENLKESHNVHVTPDECSRKKRRLDEKYRRNSPGLFTKHMAFLRGDSDKCPTFQAEPSLEEDVLAKVTFTKGAVMDTATIYSLIDVWDDMKDEYYKAHKDNQFYWKISAQMVLRGKKFSPSACQNKMNLLLSEYKAYNTGFTDSQEEPRGELKDSSQHQCENQNSANEEGNWENPPPFSKLSHESFAELAIKGCAKTHVAIFSLPSLALECMKYGSEGWFNSNDKTIFNDLWIVPTRINEGHWIVVIDLGRRVH
ncbi:uncharacterized protein LOC127749007 [Frankliniella occidentalis]|uniref:Uncharacterized protein LOC127749007 n=1 Tax=Frankliniella occidentalis TaxID=133901 RepID=A0A9C6WWT6_FRAOC|nr:uncharacterized protein LOC127749007 [Frankliniella occidentalis]